MTTVPLTLLKLTPLSGGEGPELTPYSARGLDQSLEQIVGDGVLGRQIRRTIDGRLINLSYTTFRKYQSTITCTDSQAPAFDGAWYGQTVEVECCKELAYRTGGTPQRPEVSGSSHEEGDFTYYRPVLIMMVVAVRNNFSEWASKYRWQIDLQEVG